MIVDVIFHIYKSKKYNGYKLLDGRLLHPIEISNELILIENIDIDYYNRNCNRDGRLIIHDKVKYEKIQIEKIFSYGECWESLPSGMSARLMCNCVSEDLANLLLCKIVEM